MNTSAKAIKNLRDLKKSEKAKIGNLTNMEIKPYAAAIFAAIMPSIAKPPASSAPPA